MDNELLLFDRLEMIKTTINKYGEDNFYVSFSGGKDSVVLHTLIDKALPDNKIPRVFINTGIEYNDIVAYVNHYAALDSRFVILKPTQPIKKVLEEYGYPFKSKQHSHNVEIYQNNKGMTTTNINYLGMGHKTKFTCPKILEYQFSEDFKIKISDKCCLKLKKEPAKKWAIENHKTIFITGMKSEEGGFRNYQKNCAVFDKDKNLTKFHPLKPVDEAFEDYVIEKYNIKLCRLYYPPFNFKRTGCKGCPFALDLTRQLDVMEKLLPSEAKQCEFIWKPIYDEYRRLNYRLEKNKQLKLF